MLNRFIPKTLAGQLIALLAIVLTVAQIINLALLVGVQRYQARSNAYQSSIENAVKLISALPHETPTELPYTLRQERGGAQGIFFLSAQNQALEIDDARILPHYNARFKALLVQRGIKLSQTSVTFLPDGPRRGIRGFITSEGRPPPPHVRAERGRPPPRDGFYESSRPPGRGSPNIERRRLSDLQEIRVSAKLKEGVWFNAFMPHPKTEALTSRILLATSLLLGFSLLAAWGFARRISQPLSNFSRVAERLGLGEAVEFLPETGPSDLRQAASTFNKMQTRLTHMLDTQRTMLRAVGHDLRTPLTSLRIRAENIEDDIERGKVISTLNDMTIMTEEILSWAKDASGTEDLASVDLEAFLQSMVDDYEDQGKDISLNAFQTFAVKIRRTAVKRALQNLINNALEYGGRTQLSVERKGKTAIIHIDDYGPGVPAEKLDAILKPFVRLEPSRNKGTGGTGLGLSIAQTIIQNHGGSLHLHNRESGGLRASLSLSI